jgi:hypothetical protein
MFPGCWTDEDYSDLSNGCPQDVLILLVDEWEMSFSGIEMRYGGGNLLGQIPAVQIERGIGIIFAGLQFDPPSFRKNPAGLITLHGTE